MANGDMHVELVGSRLPMIAILVGFTTIIMAISGAVVWFTKLDDRVYSNATHIAEHEMILVQHTKIMAELQSNCAKQTYILNDMVKRVERLDK